MFCIIEYLSVENDLDQSITAHNFGSFKWDFKFNVVWTGDRMVVLISPVSQLQVIVVHLSDRYIVLSGWRPYVDLVRVDVCQGRWALYVEILFDRMLALPTEGESAAFESSLIILDWNVVLEILD